MLTDVQHSNILLNKTFNQNKRRDMKSSTQDKNNNQNQLNSTDINFQQIDLLIKNAHIDRSKKFHHYAHNSLSIFFKKNKTKVC